MEALTVDLRTFRSCAVVASAAFRARALAPSFLGAAGLRLAALYCASISVAKPIALGLLLVAVCI